MLRLSQLDNLDLLADDPGRPTYRDAAATEGMRKAIDETRAAIERAFQARAGKQVILKKKEKISAQS
jgi:hypothetical protein